jgi:heme exporter protein C
MKRGTGTVVTMTLGIAALASLVATYAVGLSLPPTYEQGDHSKLIAIHPGIAWASYVAFGVTALASVLWLWPRTRSLAWDLLAGASAEVAVVFSALTLVTGSIWGRPTWGVWWVWDARLTLSALELMLLFGYLALRRVPADAEVRGRRSAIAALLAVLVVPVNHYAVEWWRTLHQDRSLDLTPQDTLDGRFTFAMVLGFLAMTLLYAWLTVHRYRLAQLEEHGVTDDLDAALEARRREAVDV